MQFQPPSPPGKWAQDLFVRFILFIDRNGQLLSRFSSTFRHMIWYFSLEYLEIQVCEILTQSEKCVTKYEMEPPGCCAALAHLLRHVDSLVYRIWRLFFYVEQRRLFGRFPWAEEKVFSAVLRSSFGTMISTIAYLYRSFNLLRPQAHGRRIFS